MEGAKTFFLTKVLLPEFMNQSSVSVRDRGGSCCPYEPSSGVADSLCLDRPHQVFKVSQEP